MSHGLINPLLDALQVTPNDYLETALMPVGGVGGAVEAKNAIRTSIKSLFPDRDCATLVRPMHDELVSWPSNDLLGFLLLLELLDRAQPRCCSCNHSATRPKRITNSTGQI
jgi:hypothetical protein